MPSSSSLREVHAWLLECEGPNESLIVMQADFVVLAFMPNQTQRDFLCCIFLNIFLHFTLYTLCKERQLNSSQLQVSPVNDLLHHIYIYIYIYDRRRQGGTQSTFPPKLKNYCRKMVLFPKALFLASHFPNVAKNSICLLNFYQECSRFPKVSKQFVFFTHTRERVTRGV